MFKMCTMWKVCVCANCWYFLGQCDNDSCVSHYSKSDESRMSKMLMFLVFFFLDECELAYKRIRGLKANLVTSLYSYIWTLPPYVTLLSSLPTAIIGAWARELWRKKNKIKIHIFINQTGAFTDSFYKTTLSQKWSEKVKETWKCFLAHLLHLTSLFDADKHVKHQC